MSKTRKEIRSSNGAVLGLVAACGTVLAIILAALFTISMLLGGSREIHNATDAGTLNLGKEIFTNPSFKVKRQNSLFEDVADKNGEFGLANVNAVWGKALLAEANAQAMANEGLLGNAKVNADMLFDEAKDINRELALKLANKANQAVIFEDLADQNSLRMLGLNSKIKASKSNAWEGSLMDRGNESNIEVTCPEVLPSEPSYEALKLKDNRIPGYKPLTIGNKTFCFVPFTDKEMTHLVSNGQFKNGTAEANPIVADWGMPIPNAFACEGICDDSMQLEHSAVSAVITNPQKLYKLSMPHSFLHITLADNQAKWLFNSPDPRVGGFDVNLSEKNGGYDYALTPDSKSGGGGSAIDGRLKGRMVPLGKEYTLSPSLETALFASDSEDGSRSKLEAVLVQRINQMISKPGVKFSKEDLHNLLRSDATGVLMGNGVQDFFIYSPDGSEIRVDSKADAIGRAQWLQNIIDHHADGTANDQLIKLTSMLILPPGIIMVDPLPGANIVVPPFGKQNIEVVASWQPGSGYGGCLGEVVSRHKSQVYLWGVAIIPAAPGAGGLLDRIGDLF